MKIVNQQGYSLVISILRKDQAESIMERAFPGGSNLQVFINSRGTIYKDKWYQKLKPSISPEQIIVETLVPEKNGRAAMTAICAAADLYGKGKGTVYMIPCQKVLLMRKDHDDYQFNNSPGNYAHRTNVQAIHCIIQKLKGEGVAIAAIRAGAHGPTINFGKGKGIRERLGLIRIAINPEKEFIRVVVDEYNHDAVFEAMIVAGKIDRPGMGFIYSVPVEEALMNVQSIATGKYQLAHQYHMIKALDDLTGGASWRSGGGEYSGLFSRTYLDNLVKCCCVVERGKSNELLSAAMEAGAPGASISFGWKNGKDVIAHGIKVNNEVEIIEMVLHEGTVQQVTDAIVHSAGDAEAYLFIQPVTKAFTYR